MTRSTGRKSCDVDGGAQLEVLHFDRRTRFFTAAKTAQQIADWMPAQRDNFTGTMSGAPHRRPLSKIS
jgi:hypothetical protein